MKGAIVGSSICPMSYVLEAGVKKASHESIGLE